MGVTGVQAFDRTLQTTSQWINDVTERLETTDREAAYAALRATLHALRDLLAVDEAAQLAAQLPMLIRGMYWEGWDPSGTPARERHREGFLTHIQAGLGGGGNLDPERAGRAVFQVLAERIPAGEIRHVLGLLPLELRDMWPARLGALQVVGARESGSGVLRLKPPDAAVEEGICAMCERRPADYLGLICQTCSDAVERNEPWTRAFDDVLAELRDLEEEEQYQP